MATTVALLAAYLLGSLSFAILVSRAMGLGDPRGYGSGNPGATNVMRSGRKLAALLTLLGDAGKGWLAVWLARRLAGDYALAEADIAAVGGAVFLGHLYPVYFGFKGGKGVATAAGVLLAYHPPLGLAVLGVWLAVFALSRVSSLSGLAAAAAAPALAAWMLGMGPGVVMSLLLAVLLFWRHRSNIAKLLAGEEGSFRGGGSPGG